MKSLIFICTVWCTLLFNQFALAQKCKSDSDASIFDLLNLFSSDDDEHNAHAEWLSVERTEQAEFTYGVATFFARNQEASDFNFKSIYVGLYQALGPESNWSIGGQLSIGGMQSNSVERVMDEYDKFLSTAKQIQLDFLLKYELFRLPHFSIDLAARGGLMSLLTKSKHIDNEEDCELRADPITLNTHEYHTPVWGFDLGVQVWESLYDRLNIKFSYLNPGQLEYVPRKTGIINTANTVEYIFKNVTTDMLGVQIGLSHYF